MQGVAEKSLLTSARGVRNESSNSIIRRKYMQGSMELVANVEIAPYLFGLLLSGAITTALAETPSSTGTADTDTSSKLVDSSANFTGDGVAVGDAVHNTTDDTFALVTVVDSATSLSLDSDAFPDGDEVYQVGTPVYEHTIVMQNANASMKAATVIIIDGSIVTERFSNVVVDSLNLEVSDEFARITVEVLGGFPDTGSHTPAYTQDTEFAYHQMTAKFGTTLANAAGNSATPLKAFSLNAANNILLDEAFLSGNNTPVAGGFVGGPFQASGSYTLHFSDTTELAKYKANTKNAVVLSLQGASIGDSDVEEIEISLGRLILTTPPIETNLDGLLVLTQEFTVEFEATDKEMKVIVTNGRDGTDY